MIHGFLCWRLWMKPSCFMMKSIHWWDESLIFQRQGQIMQRFLLITGCWRCFRLHNLRRSTGLGGAAGCIHMIAYSLVFVILMLKWWWLGTWIIMLRFWALIDDKRIYLIAEDLEQRSRGSISLTADNCTISIFLVILMIMKWYMGSCVEYYGWSLVALWWRAFIVEMKVL